MIVLYSIIMTHIINGFILWIISLLVPQWIGNIIKWCLTKCGQYGLIFNMKLNIHSLREISENSLAEPIDVLTHLIVKKLWPKIVNKAWDGLSKKFAYELDSLQKLLKDIILEAEETRVRFESDSSYEHIKFNKDWIVSVSIELNNIEVTIYRKIT